MSSASAAGAGGPGPRGSATTFPGVHVMRLSRVRGVREHTDMVVGFSHAGFSGPAEALVAVERHLVLFPGDLQALREEMSKGAQLQQRLREYSLDDTAALLARRFSSPMHLVWVVRPARMADGVYAVFEPFMHASEFGQPTGKSNGTRGLSHLAALLASGAAAVAGAVARVGETWREDSSTAIRGDAADGKATGSADVVDVAARLSKLPVGIFGFSKGGLVVTELLEELAMLDRVASTPTLLAAVTLARRVDRLVWLDSATAAMRATDAVVEGTAAAVAGALAPHAAAYMFGTPFQWDEMFKPHGKERAAAFCRMLRDSAMPVKLSAHYFGDTEAALGVDESMRRQHFQLLRDFVVEFPDTNAPEAEAGSDHAGEHGGCADARD